MILGDPRAGVDAQPSGPERVANSTQKWDSTFSFPLAVFKIQTNVLSSTPAVRVGDEVVAVDGSCLYWRMQ